MSAQDPQAEFERLEEEAKALHEDAAHEDAAAAPGDGATQAPRPEYLPSTAELLEQLGAIAWELFAPNWKITKSENHALAQAWGAVLDKWFPNLRLGPEATALLVTFAVIAPRRGLPRKVPAGSARAPVWDVLHVRETIDGAPLNGEKNQPH